MQYSIKTFENGLQLIVAPLKETKAVTVMAFVPAGSRHEKAGINGASHFVEHMIFKGTKKRPNTLAISKELDGIGANYNAFTHKDRTGYYVKADAKKLGLAMDVLSDMLFESKFDPKELDKERGVIIEEIKMYEENPLMHIDDMFERSVFRGTVLGMDIAGPKEVIAGITHRQMVNYKDSFYRPSNMVVVVAGKFDDEEVLRLAREYFGSRRNPIKPGASGDRIRKKLEKEQKKPTQRAPRVTVKTQEVDQVQLALGFPAYSYFHPDLPALGLLRIILGGNMSSRLFIQVREKRGLAYSVHASVSDYQDTGSFAIYAGLDNGRIREAVKVILSELKKVKERGVSKAELRRARDFIRGRMILSFEDSARIADWLGWQSLLKGRIFSLEEQLEKFGKVTQEDVLRVARDVIRKPRLNLALISPEKDKARFEKMIAEASL